MNRSASSSGGQELKYDIMNKLNHLLQKQKNLKEEYLKKKNHTVETDRTHLNHKALEEGKKTPPGLADFNIKRSETETIEKPFFGNFDLIEEGRDRKVSRNRRKNRQQSVPDYAGDDFHQVPDQSHSETITQHTTVHKNNNRLNFPRSTYKPQEKTDIRLEIPISLDATISLPKNKQSLEELLDFVMKHDAALLESYLQERQPAYSGPPEPPVSELELYKPPITFLSPPSGLYQPPDLSHTGYAAVVSPAPHYGVPVKLQPAYQVQSPLFTIFYFDFVTVKRKN